MCRFARRRLTIAFALQERLSISASRDGGLIEIIHRDNIEKSFISNALRCSASEQAHRLARRPRECVRYGNPLKLFDWV
jgi:hypothetical protein